MTLIAFVSARSPGLTTAVHALAATWPGPGRAMVAELDPDGGSLGARYELPPEPGLTTLAAAGRRALVPDTVMHHCRPLPDGTIALIGPVSPERVASALSVLGPRLATALDCLPGVQVLADCGRIDSHSPALELVRAARYVVMVVTPTLEGTAHVPPRLEALALSPGRVAVLTVGAQPYDPSEIGAALGLPALGALAADSRGARELASGRSARRSDLLRSAAAIAGQLCQLVETNHSAPALAVVADSPLPA